MRLVCAILVLLMPVAGCDGRAVTPAATPDADYEAAREIVDALTAAYAEYAGVERRVAGIDLNSWNKIPHPGLALGMRRLGQTTAPDAPWTLVFRPTSRRSGDELHAKIEDRDDPYCCKLFAVAVRRSEDGLGWIVGKGRHAGFVTKKSVADRVAREIEMAK